MLKINIQLFAHKKGMGSTKNGRDSESKRLGVKRADSSFSQATFLLNSAELTSIPVQTSAKAPTTPFLLRLTVPLSLRDSAKTAKRSVFTRLSSKLKHLPKKAGFSLPFFV